MARPVKEGMDYFPHDVDAVNDEKIEAMRTLYGNDGYAFYFILLERIYRRPDLELPIVDAETRQILANKIAVTLEKFDSMLETALRWGLFDQQAYEERTVLTSNGIKKRAQPVIEKRRKMRDKTRKEPPEFSHEKTQQEPDNKSETMPIEKKSKEEKSKEEKRKGEDIYTSEFESFWTVYPRRIEKRKAFKCWNTCLKEGQKAEDLIRAATNYADYCKRKGTSPDYIKHPATFLGPNKPFMDWLQDEGGESNGRSNAAEVGARTPSKWDEFVIG